jgi:glycosyltransferase involved in cell wall biosynthesis
MRVGINALYMLPGRVGGTETYLRGLLYGLSRVDSENEYVLFTNRENHGALHVPADGFRKVLCDVAAERKVLRIAFEQAILPWYVKRYGIEVLHSPGYVLPLGARCAHAVTIHDMQYAYYPGNFERARLLYWKHFVPLSARKSAVVITVSSSSRDDIVNLLGVPEEKVVVTYEASKFSMNGFGLAMPDETVLMKHGLGEGYILSVASLLPHKNLDRLIEAFSLLAHRTESRLVLVGIKGSALHAVRGAIRGRALGRVHLMGHVSDAELSALYRNAGAFVLPSLFEGFGIPLLEAMSLGCPVAASHRTAIPEIVGGAGALFDPEDPEAIAGAIQRILSDKGVRDDYIKKGFERAGKFSWDKMAVETVGAYRTAYESRG